MCKGVHNFWGEYRLSEILCLPVFRELRTLFCNSRVRGPHLIFGPPTKFINHVRVQAALDREHEWSISFTLCRGLHTLPTARVKVSKNFGPNYVMLARHHTTLLRCDCIGMLRSLYKGMQKTNNLHSYGSGRTITLPSGQHLSKGRYPKRTELYPCNPHPPLLLSEKGH
jgi:hypothetical protein